MSLYVSRYFPMSPANCFANFLCDTFSRFISSEASPPSSSNSRSLRSRFSFKTFVKDTKTSFISSIPPDKIPILQSIRPILPFERWQNKLDCLFWFHADWIFTNCKIPVQMDGNMALFTRSKANFLCSTRILLTMSALKPSFLSWSCCLYCWSPWSADTEGKRRDKGQKLFWGGGGGGSGKLLYFEEFAQASTHFRDEIPNWISCEIWRRSSIMTWLLVWMNSTSFSSFLNCSDAL